jgi:MraZ protein
VYLIPINFFGGEKRMTGVYRHTLDSKGRLFIPAKLREELGDTFYVTLSVEKCLSAYSLESWDRFMEKIMSMPKMSQKKMRPLFSHAAKCELDGQGRILLPQALRDYAGLIKNVAVVGAGECAEFWDEDSWNEVDMGETTPENLAEVFMELDF